jgi:hypothetical protein
LQPRDGVSSHAAREGVARVVMGSQSPRFSVVPEGVDHPRWPEVVLFVERLGIELDPWQLEVLRVSLMRSLDGVQWAAFAVSVCAPRQNGKNGITEIRELIGAALLGEKLVVHTAHLADTSKEAFRRLEDLIDDNEWLKEQVKHIWRTNGHEQIEFKNGCRIRFRTRTRGGGRGLSGSPVIFDEAMFLPEVSMGSILPVISAQPDPQVWYMGSAVDQTIHEDGVSFARVRARALAGDDPRLAYWEWSMDAETPDMVDDSMLDDLMELARANPALGRRITSDYIRAERRELDRRTFAVERCGVWDPPPLDGSGHQVIPIQLWDSLSDDPKSAGARLQDPVVLTFDTTPDRSRSAITAAGGREDGYTQLEVVDHRPGMAWVPERLAELVERHDVVRVMCCGSSPAESLVKDCWDLGVEVDVIETSDHAIACGKFAALVDERELRHLGGEDLRSAIKGAGKRPLGDAWLWSRKNSTVNIAPLVAGTLSVWGYVSLGVGELVVF